MGGSADYLSEELIHTTDEKRELARLLHEARERLRHYHECHDPANHGESVLTGNLLDKIDSALEGTDAIYPEDVLAHRENGRRSVVDALHAGMGNILAEFNSIVTTTRRAINYLESVKDTRLDYAKFQEYLSDAIEDTLFGYDEALREAFTVAIIRRLKDPES